MEPWYLVGLSLSPVSLAPGGSGPAGSGLGESGVGLARLALTRAWSTASSRFLESSASVWAAESICLKHSSFSDVTEFCWANRILLISSPRSLFSSLSVPSIWGCVCVWGGGREKVEGRERKQGESWSYGDRIK